MSLTLDEFNDLSLAHWTPIWSLKTLAIYHDAIDIKNNNNKSYQARSQNNTSRSSTNNNFSTFESWGDITNPLETLPQFRKISESSPGTFMYKSIRLFYNPSVDGGNLIKSGLIQDIPQDSIKAAVDLSTKNNNNNTIMPFPQPSANELLHQPTHKISAHFVGILILFTDARDVWITRSILPQFIPYYHLVLGLADYIPIRSMLSDPFGEDHDTSMSFGFLSEKDNYNQDNKNDKHNNNDDNDHLNYPETSPLETGICDLEKQFCDVIMENNDNSDKTILSNRDWYHLTNNHKSFISRFLRLFHLDEAQSLLEYTPFPLDKQGQNEMGDVAEIGKVVYSTREMDRMSKSGIIIDPSDDGSNNPNNVVNDKNKNSKTSRKDSQSITPITSNKPLLSPYKNPLEMIDFDWAEPGWGVGGLPKPSANGKMNNNNNNNNLNNFNYPATTPTPHNTDAPLYFQCEIKRKHIGNVWDNDSRATSPSVTSPAPEMVQRMMKMSQNGINSDSFGTLCFIAAPFKSSTFSLSLPSPYDLYEGTNGMMNIGYSSYYSNNNMNSRVTATPKKNNFDIERKNYDIQITLSQFDSLISYLPVGDRLLAQARMAKICELSTERHEKTSTSRQNYQNRGQNHDKDDSIVNFNPLNPEILNDEPISHRNQGSRGTNRTKQSMIDNNDNGNGGDDEERNEKNEKISSLIQFITQPITFTLTSSIILSQFLTIPSLFNSDLHHEVMSKNNSLMIETGVNMFTGNANQNSSSSSSPTQSSDNLLRGSALMPTIFPSLFEFNAPHHMVRIPEISVITEAIEQNSAIFGQEVENCNNNNENNSDLTLSTQQTDITDNSTGLKKRTATRSKRLNANEDEKNTKNKLQPTMTTLLPTTTTISMSQNGNVSGSNGRKNGCLGLRKSINQNHWSLANGNTTMTSTTTTPPSKHYTPINPTKISLLPLQSHRVLEFNWNENIIKENLKFQQLFKSQQSAFKNNTTQSINSPNQLSVPPLISNDSSNGSFNGSLGSTRGGGGSTYGSTPTTSQKSNSIQPFRQYNVNLTEFPSEGGFLYHDGFDNDGLIVPQLSNNGSNDRKLSNSHRSLSTQATSSLNNNSQNTIQSWSYDPVEYLRQQYHPVMYIALNLYPSSPFIQTVMMSLSKPLHYLVQVQQRLYKTAIEKTLLMIEYQQKKEEEERLNKPKDVTNDINHTNSNTNNQNGMNDVDYAFDEPLPPLQDTDDSNKNDDAFDDFDNFDSFGTTSNSLEKKSTKNNLVDPFDDANDNNDNKNVDINENLSQTTSNSSAAAATTTTTTTAAPAPSRITRTRSKQVVDNNTASISPTIIPSAPTIRKKVQSDKFDNNDDDSDSEDQVYSRSKRTAKATTNNKKTKIGHYDENDDDDDELDGMKPKPKNPPTTKAATNNITNGKTSTGSLLKSRVAVQDDDNSDDLDDASSKPQSKPTAAAPPRSIAPPPPPPTALRGPPPAPPAPPGGLRGPPAPLGRAMPPPPARPGAPPAPPGGGLRLTSKKKD